MWKDGIFINEQEFLDYVVKCQKMTKTEHHGLAEIPASDGVTESDITDYVPRTWRGKSKMSLPQGPPSGGGISANPGR